MKSMKKVFSMLFAMVMVLSLAACGGDDIVGEWTYEEEGIEMTYVFEDDGKGSVSVSGMTIDLEYEIDGDEITLKMSVLGSEQEEKYEFEIDGDELKLSNDNESVTLKKK